MDTINQNPKISAFVPLTYSRILNGTSLELKNLVENFKLDIDIDKEGNPGYTKTPTLPAFISKSYDQTKPEFVYNYPPLSIPKYFECVICEEVGPHSHDINCTKPFESSLYLTDEGSVKFNKPVGTSYKIIVKKRGQKKVVSLNAKSQRYPNSLILKYENENKSFTNIQLSKNGTINIKSANFKNKSVESDLLEKIHETGVEYIISDNYTYMMFSQFNLYPKEYQEHVFINLDAIHLNLWETPLFKRKIGSKKYFAIGKTKYEVNKYRYNSGDITTKSNKQSNPFIQFDIIIEPFKVGVLMYKRGAVQMRLVYNSESKNIRMENPLNINDLKNVYTFLKELFEILIVNSSETNFPIIANEIEKEKKGILNMVDGGQPKLCHNRKGRELQPVPYSFKGVCPMENYYVRPNGIKRPDGLYEPCCYKIKKSGPDSLKAIQERYIHGFSEGIPDPDTLSAVYIPGTKTVESRQFKGLNDFTKEQLLDLLEHFGYIGKQSTFKKTSKSTIAFEQFSYSNVLPSKSLFVSIPINTMRVFLIFEQKGESFFINTFSETAESGLNSIPQLSGTIMDGFYDFEEEVFYPFDVVQYKGKDVTKTEYKKRFEFLMYSNDIINQISGSLTISTNFDDDLENYDEKNTFLLFIPLNSHYTPGKINKNVSINIIQNPYISLNVEHFRGNRWKVNFEGKSIIETLLPQHEKSIEIPVVFTNKNEINDDDIVLFQINTNKNGRINYNKPLIPIEKLENHTIDHNDLINILEFLQSS